MLRSEKTNYYYFFFFQNRHTNNLILKAKQFYNNETDIDNTNSNLHQQSQRRFSQCSAASSSSGSNNELTSLPINLNSYHDNSTINEDSINSVQMNDETRKLNSLNVVYNSQSSTTLKSINAKSPQASPKHKSLNNSQLSKANSSSTTSLLLSPIRTPTNNKLAANQTPLIKKPIKQVVQTNIEIRLRTYSASRIPQINNSKSNKQILTSTAKKSTNLRSKQQQSTQITMPNKLPTSPNRRRSIATSASSTNLITNSSTKQSGIRNQTKTNLNSSLNGGKRTGLTSNKLLSQSSSSIYNQLTSYNRDKMHKNESSKRTIIPKNSKMNVPLVRTQSISSGLTSNQQSINNTNQILNKQHLSKLNGNESSNNNLNNISHNQINMNASSLNNTHHYLHSYTERQQKLKHLSNADLIVYRDNLKSMKGINEWYARDNVANFITACRNLFKIRDCLLFETDDLVMRKNERSFILCMLEIARIGSVFGMASPLIIQLEQEIDRELALEEQQRQNGTDYQATSSINTKDTDSAISSDCELEEHSNNEPPTQIVTNDLKSLHERVWLYFFFLFFFFLFVVQ